MTPNPRSASAWRWAVALGVWFVAAIAHRKVSDAVGEEFATPWGAFTPIEYTTEAMVATALVLAAMLLRRAARGGAGRGARGGYDRSLVTGAGSAGVSPACRRNACVSRLGTLALWALLLAAMAVCHHTLVTIDIEVIHYPQYALVAVLLAHALDPHRRRRVLLDVVLVSAALSLLDEALQYFHLMDKARYFDFNDLALNQLGTLAGLLWWYGFPRGAEATPGPKPLRRVLLVATGLAAAACAILVLAGVLVVNPATPITQDGTVRWAGGLRVVLQWTPDIYDNMRPSRSGGTYFVMGPLTWLATFLGTLLAAWLPERRLRAVGK